MPRFDEERFARGGEAHAAGAAFEQLHADLGFQITNLLGQRRLRDAKPTRGLNETELFGGGNKVSKVTEFHGLSEMCGQI